MKISKKSLFALYIVIGICLFIVSVYLYKHSVTYSPYSNEVGTSEYYPVYPWMNYTEKEFVEEDYPVKWDDALNIASNFLLENYGIDLDQWCLVRKILGKLDMSQWSRYRVNFIGRFGEYHICLGYTPEDECRITVYIDPLYGRITSFSISVLINKTHAYLRGYPLKYNSSLSRNFTLKELYELVNSTLHKLGYSVRDNMSIRIVRVGSYVIKDGRPYGRTLYKYPGNTNVSVITAYAILWIKYQILVYGYPIHLGDLGRLVSYGSIWYSIPYNMVVRATIPYITFHLHDTGMFIEPPKDMLGYDEALAIVRDYFRDRFGDIAEIDVKKKLFGWTFRYNEAFEMYEPIPRLAWVFSGDVIVIEDGGYVGYSFGLSIDALERVVFNVKTTRTTP